MTIKNIWFCKVCAILFLAVFLVNLAGCSTLKGMAKGAAEGFQEDWQAIKNWDNKFKENWW